MRNCKIQTQLLVMTQLLPIPCPPEELYIINSRRIINLGLFIIFLKFIYSFLLKIAHLLKTAHKHIFIILDKISFYCSIKQLLAKIDLCLAELASHLFQTINPCAQLIHICLLAIFIYIRQYIYLMINSGFAFLCILSNSKAAMADLIDNN